MPLKDSRRFRGTGLLALAAGAPFNRGVASAGGADACRFRGRGGFCRRPRKKPIIAYGPGCESGWGWKACRLQQKLNGHATLGGGVFPW